MGLRSGLALRASRQDQIRNRCNTRGAAAPIKFCPILIFGNSILSNPEKRLTLTKNC